MLGKIYYYHCYLDIHQYYRILRVSEDATLLEIKTAYRLLVKKYHPDRNSGKENDLEMII